MVSGSFSARTGGGSSRVQDGTWTCLVPASYPLSSPLPGLRAILVVYPSGLISLSKEPCHPGLSAKGSLRAGAALLVHIPPRGYCGHWGGLSLELTECGGVGTVAHGGPPVGSGVYPKGEPTEASSRPAELPAPG